MIPTATTRRVGLRLTALVLWLGLLALAWRSGLVGGLATRVLAPLLLPRPVHESVRLLSLDREAAPTPPKRGLLLAVSPERLENLLAAARPWARWLPPGLFTEGTVLRGELLYAAGDDTARDLPFAVAITRAAGPRPRLTGRYPAPDFTHLVDELYGEDLQSREEYALGHYDLEYRIRFDSFSLQSVESGTALPVTRRRLRFDAGGSVRVVLKENLFRVRTTGRIRKFTGTVDVDVAYEPGGIRLNYDVDIRDFDVDFHRVNPYLDEPVADALRRSLERSLNRKKKKRRFARRRFPVWLPLDLVVDIQLTTGRE